MGFDMICQVVCFFSKSSAVVSFLASIAHAVIIAFAYWSLIIIQLVVEQPSVVTGDDMALKPQRRHSLAQCNRMFIQNGNTFWGYTFFWTFTLFDLWLPVPDNHMLAFFWLHHINSHDFLFVHSLYHLCIRRNKYDSKPVFSIDWASKLTPAYFNVVLDNAMALRYKEVITQSFTWI